jgi:hypothetical protein
MAQLTTEAQAFDQRKAEDLHARNLLADVLTRTGSNLNRPGDRQAAQRVATGMRHFTQVPSGPFRHGCMS